MEADELDAGARSLKLPASMDHWDDLFGFVQDESRRHLQGHAKEYPLVLACEELISNMIRYNSGTLEDGSPVDIRIHSSMAQEQEKPVYRLQISDNGPAFDPRFDALNTEISEIPIEQRKIGGLGLFLIKTSVDHVGYAYKSGRNLYTIDTCI